MAGATSRALGRLNEPSEGDIVLCVSCDLETAEVATGELNDPKASAAGVVGTLGAVDNLVATSSVATVGGAVGGNIEVGNTDLHEVPAGTDTDGAGAAAGNKAAGVVAAMEARGNLTSATAPGILGANTDRGAGELVAEAAAAASNSTILLRSLASEHFDT